MGESCYRNVKWVELGGGEFIAFAPDGFDVELAGGEMFAEVGDVDVDGAGIAVEVVAPDEVEELVAGHDAVGVVDEGEEEVELFGAEFDGGAVDSDFVAVGVDGEVGELALGGGCGWCGGRGAAEDGFDAGDEFTGVKRFGEVVIGAEFEADDFVDIIGAGGEHEDGELAGSADLATDFPAIEAGEHEIENDEIWRRLVDEGKGVVAVGDGGDGELFTLEIGGGEVADIGFIVDDENGFVHGISWLVIKDIGVC